VPYAQLGNQQATRLSTGECGRSGFTLVEVLVAIALLAGALSVLAQLMVASARATASSRDLTLEQVLASQKLEELTHTAGDDVPRSSPAAWMSTEPGHVEYLSRDGQLLSSLPDGAEEAVFIRRWSAVPLPGDASGRVLVTVSVERPDPRAVGPGSANARAARMARVVGITWTGRRP
jgi:prepilin-type N-terminal cleavage/methylation domain-containing protein